MTRLVFLGTPQAAVPTLEELDSRFEVGLVITQPDRPKGRSRTPMPPPVKEAGARLGLPVAQPETGGELYDALEAGGPFDVGVVVAYGRILRPAVLNSPAMGHLNVHFSLLPRWRGAAPVERALMAGDAMTGVSIIKLDEGLDTGAVLTAQAIDIKPSENGGQLTERLAHLGARLVASVLAEYVAGEVDPVPQVDEGVTYAEKITPADRPLDLSASPEECVNKVRALAPDPAATLEIDGDRHKILAATVSEASPEPGTWVEREGLPVAAAGKGGVAILELQPPGKNPQSGADWLRGRRRSEGLVA